MHELWYKELIQIEPSKYESGGQIRNGNLQYKILPIQLAIDNYSEGRLWKRAGMTVTAYLVQCGLGKKIVWVEGLQAIFSELKAQGRNINQLAVLTNMGRVNSLQVEDYSRHQRGFGICG